MNICLSPSPARRHATRAVLLTALLLGATACSSSTTAPAAASLEVANVRATCGPTDGFWLALDVNPPQDTSVVLEVQVEGGETVRSEPFELRANETATIGAYPGTDAEDKQASYKVIAITWPGQPRGESVVASGTTTLTFTGSESAYGRCG